MCEILDAEIHLIELLKKNNEFRDSFKEYLKGVFKSARSL